MIRYESLLLAVPEITRDEITELEQVIEQTVKKFQGTLISCERWGKYRLAYPVRDNEYGVYFLIRFEVASEQNEALLADMHALFSFKKAALIMRTMTTRLEPNQSLVYNKPESLDDISSRDVDSFLREHKMDGLLPKTAVTPTSESMSGSDLEVA